jgi:phosphoribosyl 1,2-cyclic phosphodiesterase
MDRILLAVLSSGSRGNSCYLEGPEGALLVDAGLSARETAHRVALAGGDLLRVRAMFLTHEHVDHCRGAPALAARLAVPVFASAGTLEAAGEEIPGGTAVEPGREFAAGGFFLLPFPLPHDAAQPTGVVVRHGSLRVGIATDLGHHTTLVRERLAGCDAVLLESNHDEKMLMDGPYPWHLKQRIRGRHGHLSNPAAAELLVAVAHAGLQAVVLAHLSETNNLPGIALGCAREALGGGGGTRLFAAQAAAPLATIVLS